MPFLCSFYLCVGLQQDYSKVLPLRAPASYLCVLNCVMSSVFSGEVVRKLRPEFAKVYLTNEINDALGLVNKPGRESVTDVELVGAILIAFLY